MVVSTPSTAIFINSVQHYRSAMLNESHASVSKFH